jgi:hypothetical protein
MEPDNVRLAEALARGCCTYGEEAALILLLRIPGGLWCREDIRDGAYTQLTVSPPVTRVLWAVLPYHPALSDGERAALSICESLTQIGRDLPRLHVTCGGVR